MWVVVVGLWWCAALTGVESSLVVESTAPSYDNLLVSNLSTVEPLQDLPQPTSSQISPLPPTLPLDDEKELPVTSVSSEATQTSAVSQPPASSSPSSEQFLTTLLPPLSLVSNSSIGVESNVTEEYNSTAKQEDQEEEGSDSGLEDLRMLEEEGLGVWPIVGISIAVLLIAVLIGGVTFVLYRHSLWNRPQTLSDKCSNDESTGYIDDSAFRENSEELYSLDNDSFLNSLEVMTIQNYWTDHVKHTKL